jgi:hypothetical protein
MCRRILAAQPGRGGCQFVKSRHDPKTSGFSVLIPPRPVIDVQAREC